MRIELQLGRGAARRWHATLRTKLCADGHDVGVALVECAVGAPVGLAMLRLFEATIYGNARAGGGAGLEQAPPHSACEGMVDLVIDLSGRVITAQPAPCLMASWDGCVVEAGAVEALLAGRSPALAVVLRARGGGEGPVLAKGVAALPEPDLFSASFDRVCSRMGDLILQAVRRFALGPVTGPQARLESERGVSALALAGFGAANLAAKLAARLTRLAGQRPQWRVGWRRAWDDLSIDTMRWPNAGFNILADDGRRYFADPFVFQHEGVTHVLCEEVPFATGKGILSAFTISQAGVVSPVRPVLELGFHLSYPMVFRQGEAIYMIPETSANRTIELWRAARFPDQWVREKVLLDNVSASDATLVEHEGRLWIFASINDADESTWDALGLFYADELHGPWRAHRANPVLIDAGCARPGGHMARRGGRLLRPAQDCRGGYGAALSLCEVEQLDPETFRQKIVAGLAPPAGLRARGAHTLNAGGGFEVIDLCSPRI